MKNTIKVSSVNCDICSKEVLSYQIRSAKIGSFLKDICSNCHERSNTYNEFKKSLALLIELNKNAELDSQSMGPNVFIEPLDSNIQAAVELLKRMDGNYFAGVSKIVAGTEANYGHTDSREPTVAHINLSRITSETKGDNSKRNIVAALAVTIAHEIGHIKSWDGKSFVGGEGPALAQESKVENWIKANESRLQDLFK